MKNITVIGVGKLGLCFALTLEKQGYNVMGVDVIEEYIKKINNKTLSSPEPQVQKHLINSKNFVATTEIETGLEHSDILFLFVATPSLDNGRYDHSQIDKVVNQLTNYNSNKKEKHLIIGCTTMPGYCEGIQNILQPYRFSVSYNPEFIAQGSIMSDLESPDILLIGEGSVSAGDAIVEVYSSIIENKPTIHRMSTKEAEITKIALNCFLTTKIAYANMVGDIAKSAGCNPEIILNAVGSDSRVGNKNLKYGYGFGGPCFPRDNRAFDLFSNDVGIDAVISKASDNANKLHLDFQVNELKKKYKKTEQIVFSDVAYKLGTNIIEESQKLALAVELAELGYQIVIKDTEEIISQIEDLYGNKFNYQKKYLDDKTVRRRH
ncbi:MAG: UDP-glucose/GDP-mannose dehydrogenase family protein [Candidatus Marinimicrobia bacterium]|nr:UDP-glucose/GDP-mannose dehydrogenase family protein [Candidatus Neomarinimicrobiota bacterium]